MTVTDTDEDLYAKLAERLRSQIDRSEFPLSYPQQRPWFLSQLRRDSPAYNLPLGYRLRGPLDPDALAQALTEVVRRHEVLRSVFHDRQGKPCQIVLPPGTVPLPLTDLSDAADPEAEARRIATEEARTPFDLAHGPILRARLLRLAPEDHLFLLSLHHIACDAWSVGIVGREVQALYAAIRDGRPSPLPDLRMQYADFAEWQLRTLEPSRREELTAYWKARLDGIPACINLPTDRPRPPVQGYAGSHEAFDIDDETVAGVDRLARRQGVTPYAVFLAAFSALLSRYTGGEDVVIGTPVANRHHADLETVVGFFTNTLVLRPDLAGGPTFEELVARVGRETRLALANQDLPFEVLVEELHPHRDTAYSPVFQVMFIYWDGDDEESWSLPGCETTAVPGDSGTAKFDLTLSLTRRGAGVSARLEYAIALYDEQTVRRMARQFETLLRAAVSAPGTATADLPAMPEEEWSLLMDDWAVGRPVDGGSAVPVHDLIAAQAARTPQAPAVTDDERTLSYRELDGRSDRLAARLRGLGVGPDTVVGVFLDRSVDTIVALLGVLKAGGAYLPLDPGYPTDRLAFMVTDSRAPVVVTRAALAAAAAGLGAEIVNVDDITGSATAGAPPTAAATGLESLAYLIYTSGSTGRPKGVMVSHRNVAAFFAAMNAEFGEDPPGTWLSVTSISFDISVLELLWTLSRGYRVVIRGDEPSTIAPAVAAKPGTGNDAGREVAFGLHFFGNSPVDGEDRLRRYRTVLESAKFADQHGFAAVWTPERHFHEFGGLYPNPSVLGAAIAATTSRIGIRAGSVVLPLHDPIRVAEEWAVVDNLSGGRVGISFASGWQPNDFVLAPGNYADRKRLMLDAIAEVRRLWRGDRVRRRNGADDEIEVAVFPRPIQYELPVWITSARHPETFRMAGEAGAGLLTHVVGHTFEQLAEKITLYREAWREGGHDGDGHVTVMLHTHVGDDTDAVRARVREPLKTYIGTSFNLMAGLGDAFDVDLRSLPEAEVDALLDRAFDRFFETSGLFGTPDRVADVVDQLGRLGVDEIGCLVDFGVADDDLLAGLGPLAAARDDHLQRRERRSGRAVAEETVVAQLRSSEVTHFQCTPSLANVLVSEPQADAALGPLRRMLVGGEALPPDLASSLAEKVGGSVHNMYGPTEATVWATSWTVQGGQPVRIGRPLPGYRVYVVDAALRPVPIGAPGELLIGGDAVARGYHGRQELTEERFVADPFSGAEGARLYRTGDLGRYRADGQIEFLGRLDHQVKLRGRRIELGEVEAAVVAHPAVGGAVADIRGEGDGRRIAVFCVTEPGARLPSPDVMRTFLGRSLPDYMLPSAFVPIDALPLTPNGKVDRRRLPEIDTLRPDLGTRFRAPASELECAVAEIWKALLGIDRVGVEDNFFELGGNSILAVAMRNRLQERTHRELSLVDMFRYPTVGALAAVLAGRDESGDGGPTPDHQEVRSAANAAGRRRAALARGGRKRAQRSVQ